MIHVLDLICMNMSHEKVNSGFIYGLRLAFPNEKIFVYADKSHTDALASILKVDSIEIGNIEYVPVSLGNQNRLLYYPRCYFVLKSILKNVLRSSDNKVFFLSFNNVILHIIKKVKRHKLFAELKFALVLHGVFEKIAESEHTSNLYIVPTSPLIKRLKRYPLSLWPAKALASVSGKILGMYQNKVAALYAKFFTLRELLLLDHSLDYKYIALSSHIIENARSHIDTEQLNIHLVTMPTVFSNPIPVERNNYPKFAIFGYGNAPMLHQVLTGLSKLKLTDPYEIRNIGSNNVGIEGFPNVTVTSSGNRLTRSEMEGHARDIDIFLLLHPGNTYQLSCSASIFEALSYVKPILHFDNDCINTYNTKEMPIGFTASTIEEFVDNMASIIKGYNAFLSDRDCFISNIIKLRDIYSIEKSKEDIAKSFSWPDEGKRQN
jgi:hypothetical protein